MSIDFNKRKFLEFLIVFPELLKLLKKVHHSFKNKLEIKVFSIQNYSPFNTM